MDPGELGWQPTPENINALPSPLRRYIHDLETLCDPAGIVRENTILRDTVLFQEALIIELDNRQGVTQ